MIKQKQNYWVLLLLLFLGCTNGKKKNSSAYILTTTGMIGDAVKNIVQGKISVQVLMGPGVDPHLYRATRNDVTAIKNADIIFYNGLHLEGKLVSIFEKMKLSNAEKIFAVSENIPNQFLLSTEIGGVSFDPHIWFSIPVWKYAVEEVYLTLVKKYPKDSVFFSKNYVNHQKQLDSAHFEAKEKITSIPKENRVLITAHDAFGYFSRDYAIPSYGLQGISTLSDYSLKDIETLITLIVEKEIRAVFSESSVNSKGIKAIVEGCEARGHTLTLGPPLYSDALGAKGTLQETFIGTFQYNVASITNALRQ